jgi:hypothetical protein
MQGQCTGGVDDLDPFGATVLGQARGDGREVSQRKAGEIQGVGAGDVAAAQVNLAELDAALFEVAKDGVAVWGANSRFRGFSGVERSTAAGSAQGVGG